ncbi:MAG TPA: hypothetical protein ENF82_04600 [Candidatus Methanomethylia archaeon]|nr:hypothetical protein [Candidatus Methanomethylicia archaeon]
MKFFMLRLIIAVLAITVALLAVNIYCEAALPSYPLKTTQVSRFLIDTSKTKPLMLNDMQLDVAKKIALQDSRVKAIINEKKLPYSISVGEWLKIELSRGSEVVVSGNLGQYEGKTARCVQAELVGAVVSLTFEDGSRYLILVDLNKGEIIGIQAFSSLGSP